MHAKLHQCIKKIVERLGKHCLFSSKLLSVRVSGSNMLNSVNSSNSLSTNFINNNSIYSPSNSDSEEPPQPPKDYDYVLKFLLVGDSDVGKEEILNGLDSDSSFSDPHFCGSPGVVYKSTQLLLDGRRIRLQLWDTSGQGRFSTIIRSYSRGAQGILMVYDITNKWSFSGLNRWLQEVEEHAPGVPKILVGNRLHLAFKRQVNELTAEAYAKKHDMSFFEVSPLCNYNIRESFAELSRVVLKRNGMENFLKANTVLSLQELCCRSIVNCTTSYGLERLPLPPSLKSYLQSYSTLAVGQVLRQCLYTRRRNHSSHNHLRNFNSTLKKKAKALFTCDSRSSSSPSSSASFTSPASNHRTRYRQNSEGHNRFSNNCAIS